MITEIINELNLENGSNYKKAVLEKHKDNELLKETLQKTYDKVRWTWGVALTTIDKALIGVNNNVKVLTFEEALKAIEKLHTREVTGNAAIDFLNTLFEGLDEEDRDVIIKVLRRDLRINVGRTNINKVFKGLIVKPVYMRCSIFTTDKMVDGKMKKGTAHKIKFPAIINLKADGTFRLAEVNNNDTTFLSRQGEESEFNGLRKAISVLDDCILNGEMTIKLTDPLLATILPKLEKLDKKNKTNNVEIITTAYDEHKSRGEEYILPRSIGNGLINSDDEIPEENLIYDLWDMITPEDYTKAAAKDKKNPPVETYRTRFENLKKAVALIGHPNVRIIEHKEVENISEALEFVTEKMNQGLEGGILKNWDMLFKDGTQTEQLKLKLEIDGDFRCYGFIEGTPGTKTEATFGGIMFKNDEETIIGSVSGFTDEDREEINSNRDDYIGKVLAIQFNDITKSRSKTTWALSHPRFIEWRDDKDDTDSLERCLEMKNMAMNLKES